MVICLTHGNGIGGGEGSRTQGVGGGVGEAKCLGEGRVMPFVIQKRVFSCFLFTPSEVD